MQGLSVDSGGNFCFTEREHLWETGGITLTERERMLSGRLYNAGDPELAAARLRAKNLCRQFNDAPPDAFIAREELLRQLLGRMGKDCWIESPFRCDYGSQITLGDSVYANYDCIFLDVAPITIGSHAFLAPRVCLFTAGHPLDAEVRNSELEFGLPITIADNVWLGGNVTVLPGVTIGAGTVVAAGSVVTKDLPAGVVAAGNPCRVLRALTDADRALWEARRAAYEAERER